MSHGSLIYVLTLSFSGSYVELDTEAHRRVINLLAGVHSAHVGTRCGNQTARRRFWRLFRAALIIIFDIFGLQFVAWHVHLASFGRGEILLTTRPATGEPAEEGLADVMVGKEGREDSARLAAASRATRRLIRQALKTVAQETLQFGWRGVYCFAFHKPSAYTQPHHPSTSATFSRMHRD